MSPKNLSVKNKIPKNFTNILKKKRIYRIYKKFEDSLKIKSNFAVAVSGGPDSMALVFLTKIYSIKNGLSPKIFIVNHNLRKGSTNEAKSVRKTLKKFSINSKIINWKGKKPKSNLQGVSRNKRYELLFKECKKSKITNILLGHHLDDLLENFFLRILRGSGLKGLTSLGKETTINNINLLRPLIDIKKDDLEFISKNVFSSIIQDPSNVDNKFKRVRIRNLIEELKKNGLDKEKYFLTIRNLKDADAVIRFYKEENIKENTFYVAKKNKFIINNEFFNKPNEIVFRSFSELVKMIGKRYYEARGKKSLKVIESLKTNKISKVTIGGCIIEKVNQTVILSKEFK